MLSKQSVFKLVKGALRSRSLRPVESFQDSLDHHLRESLRCVRLPAPRNGTYGRADHAYGAKASRYSVQKPGEGSQGGGCAPVGEPSSRGVGVDSLKPFELVMGFQLLALQCSSAGSECAQDVWKSRVSARLYALLLLAWHQMDDFSFVKLSLVLNALSNIAASRRIKWLMPGILTRPDGMNTSDSADVESCVAELPDLYGFAEDIGYVHPARALETFHASAISRASYALRSSIMAEPNAPRGEAAAGAIDSHSVCMALRYVATLQSVDVELLYLMNRWLLRYCEPGFRDELSMVVSLSMLEAPAFYQPFDSDRIAASITAMEPHYSPGARSSRSLESARGNLQTGVALATSSGQDHPGSVVELLLTTLAGNDAGTTANVQLLPPYFEAIGRLGLNGVGAGPIGKMARRALDKATAVLGPGGPCDQSTFEEIGALLRSIGVCARDSGALEPHVIRSWFLSPAIQRCVSGCLLSIVRGPSCALWKSISDISAFLRLVCAGEALKAEEEGALDRLRGVLENVVSHLLLNHSHGVTIRDMVGAYDCIRGNRRLELAMQTKLLGLYSAMASGPHDPNLVHELSETAELFHYIGHANASLERALHSQISAYLSVACSAACTHHYVLFMRLLRSLSRVCKADSDLCDVYDWPSMFGHVFEGELWKDHAVVLMGVIHNLRVHTAASTAEQVGLGRIGALLEHYFNAIVVPVASASYVNTSDWRCSSLHGARPPVDISTFAKYVHVVWSLRDVTPDFHSVWERVERVVVHDIYAFTNGAVRPHSGAAPTGAHVRPRVLRSQMWQCFSLCLVADVLLNLHRVSVSQGNVQAGQLSREQEALSFLFRMLFETFDVSNDHLSPMLRLSELVIGNVDALSGIPELGELGLRLAANLRSLGCDDETLLEPLCNL